MVDVIQIDSEGHCRQLLLCTAIFYDKINSESCLQHQPESYVVNLP